MGWRRAMHGAILTLVAVAMPVAAQDAIPPAVVTPGDFAGLGWLAGRWVGSGGGYDAFYESYRFLDAVTLEQTTHPDAGFGTVDGRSTLELRDGHLVKFRDGRPESVVTRLAGDTLRFQRTRAGSGGFTWIRVGDDEWKAVLDRPGGGEPVVYVLRRVR